MLNSVYTSLQPPTPPPSPSFLKIPLRPSPLNCSAASSSSSSMDASGRIAVVGDVHDFWNLEEDSKALQFLQPDLVLFTGDFGNENVELVQSVADLKYPKAIILGNHDAWSTHRISAKKKDNVQLQLEILGEEHVGYRHLDFPSLKLSVVGGRPFSCGGDHLFREKVLGARFGVQDMNGSAKRIYNASLETPEDHLLILLAHNGPTGLGSNRNDICGKDWWFGGGDHGDPDLAEAISNIKETTELRIPLVVFGHMHKELAYGQGLRKMIVIGTDNTIYLNGAIVPRVKGLRDEQGSPPESFTSHETSPSIPESKGTLRAFTLVDIVQGKVDKVSEAWVSVVGDETKLEQEQVLFKRGN